MQRWALCSNRPANVCEVGESGREDLKKHISYESWMFLKENQDRKKSERKLILFATAMKDAPKSTIFDFRGGKTEIYHWN